MLRVAAATLIAAVFISNAHAAEAGKLKIVRAEGGISPNPILTSIAATTNKTVKLSWQSFGTQITNANPVVYNVVRCPALQGSNTTWTTVASVTNANNLTTALEGEVGILAVQQDPAPAYAGAKACLFCHSDYQGSWMETAHAGALQSLKAAHSDKNASCLPCHTIGYGSPNGYKDEETTPEFAGVQCESCHGPAAAHAKHPLDKSKRPIKTLAAEMCGGCHTDAHHPTYDEFAKSAHGTTLIPEEEFADPTNGPPRMLTCGACHSAATRVALLNGVEEMNRYGTPFSPEMPSTEEASTTAITCVACHDAHSKTEHGAQLRFPIASKVPYSYLTATNFAANYNEQVQTCGQCHNLRGATWTGTSRPPHHSPQYNMLIGDGGFVAGSTNVPQSAHMDLTKQCAQCHTHPHSPPSVTESSPAYTGHEFSPTMQACAPCHDEIGATVITEAVQANTRQQIQEVKGLLDQWAVNKAPEALRTKYGKLAWEFNVIGQLSAATAQNPSGPTATEQKAVPDAIKQARYNLYLVEHDGSYGIHNGNYARFLLKVARDQVTAALNTQ